MFRSVAEFPPPTDPIWTTSFHCFICNAVHTRTIVLCEGGHFICHSCSASLTKCNCSKKITKVRAQFLENIVRASKFHCEHDCGINLTNEEYSFHVEEGCRFRPINCPLCHSLIEYKNYLRHLRRVHNLGTFQLDENGEGSLFINNDTEPMYFTTFLEKTFFLRWAKDNSKFWVQSFQNSNGISVSVDAATFRSAIRISKAHSGLNCPDIDVVHLSMNERVKLKFNCSTSSMPSPTPSAASTPVAAANNEERERPMFVRDSVMSMSSTSSDEASTRTSLVIMEEEHAELAELAEPPLPPPTSPPRTPSIRKNLYLDLLGMTIMDEELEEKI